MKRKTRKSKTLRLILIVFFIIGLGVLLYPTIADLWNRQYNSKEIHEYSSAVEKLDDETIAKSWADAQAYNAQHTQNVIVDAFENEENYMLSHPYDQLLNPSGNEIMGYIRIPKIKVELAIYHGIGTDELEKGVGHVEGTSLPSGGAGTHSVLAAHRGLPSAKLFTDLDQMKNGDQFYLQILDQTLAYEVDSINVVQPDDSSLLQIEEGQDLVTLLTCTPYGVNTERLLVRGHRVPYTETAEKEQSSQITVSNRDLYVLLPVIVLAIWLLMFILYKIIRKIRNRKTKVQSINETSKENGQEKDDEKNNR